MLPSKPPRSLIVLPVKGMADTILLLPALERLVESLPYAEVAIGYINDEQEEVLKLSTLSVPKLALHSYSWRRRWGWAPRLFEALRSIRHNRRLMRSFDQVVFLDAERLVPRIWVRTALRAQCRVLLHSIEEGYYTSDRCAYYQRAVAHLLNLDRHTSGTTRLPKLTPSAADRQWADAFLRPSAAPRKLIVYLNPCVTESLEIRRWSKDGFATLGGELVRRGFYLLIHHQDAVEAEWVRPWVEPLPGHAELLPALTLGQTAAVMARCALYIGNDTPLAQVALAVGIPALTIFGPTPDELYAGHNPRQTVIKDLSDCPIVAHKSTQACPGCERFDNSAASLSPPPVFPYPCLRSIQPAAVIAAVDRAIEERRAKSEERRARSEERRARREERIGKSEEGERS